VEKREEAGRSGKKREEAGRSGKKREEAGLKTLYGKYPPKTREFFLTGAGGFAVIACQRGTCLSPEDVLLD
jgi:hypothetical protein